MVDGIDIIADELVQEWDKHPSVDYSGLVENAAYQLYNANDRKIMLKLAAKQAVVILKAHNSEEKEASYFQFVQAITAFISSQQE